MPYRVVPFPGFGGGLNLRDQPDAIRADQAVDCLDVEFTQIGAVKQRAGYDNLTASELTNRADSLAAFYKTDGTKQLLAGCGTRLEAISTAGAIVASQTGLSGGPYTFARFGAPNTEVAYAGNGTDTLSKWTGAAWSSPTATVDGTGGRAMPKAGAICVMPKSNRLVATGFATTTGGPNGATSSPSHVYFSDPGLPETWNATSSPTSSPPTYANYIQVRPGDGEAIQAVVPFRNSVLVFKETCFAEIYGESTNSDGSPIFDFELRDYGCGLASRRAIAVARDGVYFMDRKGVYRTTGGPPELVSGPLDPFFVGGASSFFQSSVLSHANITNSAMTWHDEKIWLACSTAGSTNDRLLVHDPRYGWWTMYSIPAAALCPFRISSQAELSFAYATGSKHVGRHSSGYTTDDGTTITARWQSGWQDYGSPDVKTLREFKCWGSGKVNAAQAKDFQTQAASSDLVDFTSGADTWSSSDTWDSGTWGSGVVLTPQLVRRAVRGTTYSLVLSSYLDQAWTFERMTSHLREVEIPSTVKEDA